MNLKTFYETHRNFSKRSRTDYFISPGIKCKFDLIIERVIKANYIPNAADLGCSGDSILCFINNIKKKSFLDITNEPLYQFKNEYCNLSTFEKAYYSHLPVCGDIQNLPYKADTFGIVFALDVLEHVKNDEATVAEISRILKKHGIAIISVPNRKKYYTIQDKLIGHYRRYEFDEITQLFYRYNLRCIDYFGIYGILMKLSFVQGIKPDFTEEKILDLRRKYDSNTKFRIVWDSLMKIASKMMKLDAKYTPLKYIMNMAYIFMKF